jgi:hypothetical protein
VLVPSPSIPIKRSRLRDNRSILRLDRHLLLGYRRRRALKKAPDPRKPPIHPRQGNRNTFNNRGILRSPRRLIPLLRV